MIRFALGPVRERFERGELLRDLAAEVGCTRQTLAKHLRRAGVDTSIPPRQRIRLRAHEKRSAFVDGLLKMKENRP